MNQSKERNSRHVGQISTNISSYEYLLQHGNHSCINLSISKEVDCHKQQNSQYTLNVRTFYKCELIIIELKNKNMKKIKISSNTKSTHIYYECRQSFYQRYNMCHR